MAESKHGLRVHALARGSNPLSELHLFKDVIYSAYLVCLRHHGRLEEGSMCAGFPALEAAHTNDPFLSGRRWRRTVICSTLLSPVSFPACISVPLSKEHPVGPDGSEAPYGSIHL